MESRIIGISGNKGSGKDTIARWAIKNSPVNMKRFAFADALKDDLEEMGLNRSILDGTQKQKESTLSKFAWGHPMFTKYANCRTGRMTYREVMQVYGTEVMRGLHGQDYWIRRLTAEIQEYLDEDSYNIAVITDVRFASENDYVRNMGGTTVRILGGTSDDHSSEQGVYEVDYTIKGAGMVSAKETKVLFNKVLWSTVGVHI